MEIIYNTKKVMGYLIMINRVSIEESIRNSLPNLKQEIIQQLADDVILDILPVIHAIIRKVVAQEREKQYVADKVNAL